MANQTWQHKPMLSKDCAPSEVQGQQPTGVQGCPGGDATEGKAKNYHAP